MKVISKIASLFLVLGILAVISGGILFAVFYPYGGSFDAVLSEEFKREIDINEEMEVTDDIKNIDISAYGKSVINVHEGNNIIARTKGKYYSLNEIKIDYDFKKEGSTIKFKINGYSDFNFLSLINITDFTTEILIPQSFAKSLKISGTWYDTNATLPSQLEGLAIKVISGKLTLNNVNDINVNTFDVSINSGSLLSDGKIIAVQSNFEVSSGNIDVKVNSEELVSKVSSGGIRLEGDFKSVDSGVTSGSLLILGNIENLDFTVWSGSIKIESDKIINVKGEISSGTGRIIMPYTNDINLNVKVSSGSFVNNYGQTSGNLYEMKVSVSSGEFKLEKK